MIVLRKDTKPTPVTLGMIPGGTAFEFEEPCSIEEKDHVYIKLDQTGYGGEAFADLKTGCVYVYGRKRTEDPVRVLNAKVITEDAEEKQNDLA